MDRLAQGTRGKRVRILIHEGFGGNRQRTFSVAAIACYLVSSLCSDGTAHAQVSSALAPEADTLVEIIVTARKRSEDVQKIPETVVSLDSKLLEDSHFTKIDDLQNFATNLVILTRPDNTPDVVMRGVGSLGIINGVGFFVNDVQLLEGQTVRPEDIERVEVLKSPPPGHALRRQ